MLFGKGIIMDKTTFDLITIIIAVIGVFMALKKYSPPELNMTFYGENLFSIKKDIIEKRRKWVFALFVVMGLSIQIIEKIFFPRLQEHIHTNNYYIFSFILILLIMLFFAFLLDKLAKSIAKKKWLPELVEKLREAYKQTSEIIENRGLERKQLDLTNKEQDLIEIIHNNYKRVDERLERIEKLLDIRRKGKNREERIKLLKKFYME